MQDVQGNKPEQNCASQGPRIRRELENWPFTGWCDYGYWQDGQLTRGKPAHVAKIHAIPFVKLQSTEQERSEAQTTRRNTAKSRQERTGAILGDWLAQIPTLDEWKR